MAEILADYHAQYPLRPGMAREELKSRVQGREKWPPSCSTSWWRAGRPRAHWQRPARRCAGPAFASSSRPHSKLKVDGLLAAFRKQPYTPPSMAESVAQTDPEILSALMHQGTLVRLSEDVLLLGETYEEMVGRIVAFIRANGSMTVAQVRDEFNTSRKYALALMERLDEQKITRRVGDERVLR